MNIVVDCPALRSAIDVLSRVTGAEHANLEIDGKNIFVTATGQSRSCRMHVTGEVESKKGADRFGFNVSSMLKILRGRDKLTMAADKDNTVTFDSSNKGTKFSGEFQALPYEEISIVSEDSASTVNLGSKELAGIQNMVTHLQLTNLVNTEPMILNLEIGPDGLYGAVYDDYHAAYAHDPSVTTKKMVTFSLPLALYQLIASVAGEREYSFVIGMAYVGAKAIDFEVSLPVMQAQSLRQLNMPRNYFNSLGDMSKIKDTFAIDKAEFGAIMENLSAFNDGTVGIVVEAKKSGYINMSCSSPFGKGSDKRKVKVDPWKHSYTLNPVMFMDVFNAYPLKQIQFWFSGNAVLTHADIGSMRVHYSCILM